MRSIVLFILISICLPAFSQEGVYFGPKGGVTFLNSYSGEDPAGVEAEIDFKTGFNIGGVIGRGFSNGFRAEAEFIYRQNSLQTMTILDDEGIGLADPDIGVDLDGTRFSLDGNIRTITGMGNLWYDLTRSTFSPYIGGGIGFTNLDGKDISVTSVTFDDITVSAGDVPVPVDDNTDFAWQGGVGITYTYNTNSHIAVDYRYFSSADYNTHNISLSLLYSF